MSSAADADRADDAPRERPATPFEAEPRARDDAVVAPLLPLALLESIRDHDRPSEVLEDEDLTASLPRRLGLKGVVDAQIVRYRDSQRRGAPVPAAEVENLLRLVLRRPDGAAILREAGRSMARVHYRRVPGAARTALRILPRSLLYGTIRRSAGRLLRRTAGGGSVELPGKPFAVRLSGGLAAYAEAEGPACVLYGAALEELLSLYSAGRRVRLRQTHCATRGGDCCEWHLDETESA